MTGERVVVRYAMVFDPLANHACKIVQRADGAYVSYDDYVALRAQVAALAADGQRLDWLDAQANMCGSAIIMHESTAVYGKNVREALDAARGGEG